MLRKSLLRNATLLAGLALAVIAQAVGQNPRGSLRGTVQDATGARVTSAKIVVESSGSAIRRETVSEDRGEFRVDDLAPGAYRITVSAEGFAPAQANVSIAVSSVREVAVTLKAAAPSESVSVKGQSSSITTQPMDVVSVVHQGVISSGDLETLPLAARSFANIAYLAPGTEPVEPSDPTKARISAVSTGGSSGLNNDLSVDGGDNSDDWIGGFLQNISPDAIQEFAVRTANEDADTGGTTAGSVVITTKRGTNEWHGSGAFYERASELNARFPIENPAQTCAAGRCVNNPKQPFSRQNYVATAGGPMARNKVWVFSSFEYVHENASIAYSPVSAAEFNALAQIAADGLIPGVPSIAVPANVPIPFRDYIGSLRFDWAQSQKSQWFLRTSEDSYLTHNALVQQATLPSTGLTTHNNYWNTVISNTDAFSSTWLGTFVFDASLLHLTQTRNSTLGFALAFPFSSTTLTVSGFETYGDNQFATPITLFPSLRNQQKYQLRYDVGHATGDHSFKFGVNFIHEPVLGGAFPGNQETLYSFPNDPTFYTLNATNLAQFPIDYANGAGTTPASSGNFSQSVQRLGLYAQDSWRITRHFTVNYGLRWQTTFGLFVASGHDQTVNPWFPLLPSFGLPERAPQDYRRQFGPRLGIAYSPGDSGRTVFRAGFGLFYNDLAQNGWAAAFQAVNGGANPPAALIDPNYKTPYALHATGGVQHAINANWTVSADYTHEEGNHAYRAYPFAATVFRSDNRSSYNALMLHLQGNVTNRFNLVANYTLSKAQTWGCVLGELFDYVNGVCDPTNAFAPGDYGPSGEDVRHRFVLAGTVRIPGGFELTTMTQAEAARPFTITTQDNSQRISVNGTPTALDAFRGTPYVQMDLRVTRPFKIGERWEVRPFAEFFNVFNRNNPGANFVGNISGLPLIPSDVASGNATTICLDFPTCAAGKQVPVTSFKQLEIPAGGLGDFFGPGTTVGIPFAAQLGVRVNF
ncbi:MAG TPA: carboxypeptidase regulatory-like domain-containing protein [Candidatus Dormibacteraeota bacterium]|nr:carboxypeptidase regulatory-like domain-containing protein [Candidatus Dormibacteraeota bacterium]